MRRRIAAVLTAVVTVPLPALGLLTAPTSAARPAGPADAAHTAAHTAAPAERAAADRSIRLRRWTTGRDLLGGTRVGTEVVDGSLVFGSATGTRRWNGTTYDAARWLSPWTEPGFSYTELIASWSARTPRDSWIEISVRGRNGAGRATSWDVMARWKGSDRRFERHSGAVQDDDGTRLATDTWRTGGLTGFQLRVTLLRRTDTSIRPSVDSATVMTSRLPSAAGATSEPGVAAGTVLRVPRASQMIHEGHYPQWGGGGEAWCSPTSTSMVLSYYDALPPAKAYDWVPSGHVDPWVDHAARMTYDHAYDGTGNWPFNTAYAASRTGKAFVTRLRTLREAERFIAAGIPLVASIAFGPGELDGAPISASNGHLLVVAGFRDNGDVVVNDPAARTRKGVRRTYDRGQLERLWLEASGGLVYVIHDDAHPLPGGRHSNW